MNTPQKNQKIPQKSFLEMGLVPTLLSTLSEQNFHKPTAIQAQAVPFGLNNEDVVGIAETGSGKTLAFALVVLQKLLTTESARGLVLAPSREMAQQIHKVFMSLYPSLEPCLVIGGLSSDKQISHLRKKPRIIIATPGRLYDHLISNKLLLQGTEIVVVDEADRMLDMGFAPQLKNVLNTLRGERQTLMFSASFAPQVEEIAKLFMKHKYQVVRTEKAEAPVSSLKQQVLLMDRSMKWDRLLDDLNATKGGVIVFTGNQESCIKVGKYLEEYGYESDYTHGAQTQGHRNRVIREFREGKIRIVVATDMWARGLDISHVEHVINFELPFQAEDFLHRIGRTARAGRSGVAITYITPSDQKMYQKIKPYLGDAVEVKLDPRFEFIARSKGHVRNAGMRGKARPTFNRGADQRSNDPAKNSAGRKNQSHVEKPSHKGKSSQDFSSKAGGRYDRNHKQSHRKSF